MSVRRPTPLVILVAFVLAIGASAHAQFGNLLKKKLPTPGAPAAAPGQKPYCSDITDEMIDRFLKALQTRRLALERVAADERQRKAEQDKKKAEQDKKDQGKAERMVADIVKYSECTQAFEEKDPRTKERNRLQDASSAAYDKGDNANGEKLDNQAQAVSAQINADAERACAHVKFSMDKYGPSAEEQAAATAEQAASDAAREAMQLARLSADHEAAKSQGFTDREFAKMLECTTGRLNNPTATPTTPDSAAAIDQRADDLRKALGQ
jgi:hypothetical protein